MSIEVVLWSSERHSSYDSVYPKGVFEKSLRDFVERSGNRAICGEARTLGEYRQCRDFLTNNPAREAFTIDDCRLVDDSNRLVLIATITPAGPRADLICQEDALTFSMRAKILTGGVPEIITWDAIVPSCKLTEVINK